MTNRAPNETVSTPRATALTIAGSDPSGGAGLQADLKTFFRFGVYGQAVVTLVTAQNTRSVEAVHVLEASLVAHQLRAVLDDIGASAAKTGALGTAQVIDAIADTLDATHKAPQLVIDPVMVSKHGHRLIGDDAVDTLVRRLFSRASLVTPNLPEAQVLLGKRVEGREAMQRAALELLETGARAVLLKGGHGDEPEAADVLVWQTNDRREVRWYRAPRIDTVHTHGTGCTYSAAITALLASGHALPDAVDRAKRFVTRAIAGAPKLGGGQGPVDHFAAIDDASG